MSSSSIEKANNANVHFHAEILLLKKALADKQAELSAMRSACYQETDRRGEIEDVVLAWQDKFERLYESHKKVQKINQTLEDKLLKLVDRNSSERAQLTSDCATLQIRLSQANYNISSLQREIDRYKQDINLAIQLLHCKPDSFLPQKVNSLPLEMQSKVTSYMKLDHESECSNGNLTKGKYQILPTNEDETFASDHNKKGGIKVSPVVVAKFLENELKSKNVKHCGTCFCAKKHLEEVEGIQTIFNIAIQTDISTLNCLRCNSNLNSPSHTNSPYLIKLKSSDSVISETKSSMSDFTNLNDKSFTPSKVDDLKVNPILGHHRLCEHNYQPKTDELIKGLDLPQKSESSIVRNKDKTSDAKLTAEDKTLSHGAGNGSNNSLWSKTSSKDGAKLFENFNRNLIKAMRAENPRKLAPRICALKFQNGTNNIMLDSPQGEAKMYTRRPRLLDEELIDDEKDISGNVPMNFESSQSSVVLSTASNQSNSNNHEIFSTNKTDSEKFNEIQSKEVSVPPESIVVVKERELTINVGKIARSSEIFCDSVSSEIDVRDNIMLRRQQLTRVAEWVNNSSNIQLPNMQKMETLNDCKVLDYENNNANSSTLNQMYKESLEKNAQNSSTEKLGESVYCAEPKSLSIQSDELGGDGKIDLAQMEYNVKKFLLKQNEWNRSISGDSYAASKSECDEETIFNTISTEKLANFLVQRTETNL